MTRTMLLLSVAAAVAASLAVAVPKAAADSYGCTWAPFGNVCILIEGDGLHVDHVRVRRAKIDYELICGYRAVMTVRNKNGRVIDRRKKGPHRGCTPVWAWFDWYPDRNYPDGSTICTAWFERGVLQGKPCNGVHD
jgi:hypothetical protein